MFVKNTLIEGGIIVKKFYKIERLRSLFLIIVNSILLLTICLNMIFFHNEMVSNFCLGFALSSLLISLFNFITMNVDWK